MKIKTYFVCLKSLILENRAIAISWSKIRTRCQSNDSFRCSDIWRTTYHQSRNSIYCS